MAAPNFDDIFVSVVTDFDQADLHKWSARLVANKSSFAIVDGKLYLSQASQDFLTGHKETDETPRSR
jgi:hypothetical protein